MNQTNSGNITTAIPKDTMMKMQAVKKRATWLNMKLTWMKLMDVSCRLKFYVNQRCNSTHPQFASWTILKMNGHGEENC
eukprot:12893151-Prorocentrum_lima.AAC.1